MVDVFVLSVGKKKLNVDRNSMLKNILITGFLAACASTEGPVSMQVYESDFFSIEFPQGWYSTSHDIFDTTKVVFSKGELSLEAETALEGPGFTVEPSDYPFFLVMFTPYQPAGEETLENTVQAFIATISQGQGDYKIVEQSSSLPRDAEVRAFIVEGSDAELGRVQGHMLFALSDWNAGAIMISWTGEKDSEINMRLFDEMRQSFRFQK